MKIAATALIFAVLAANGVSAGNLVVATREQPFQVSDNDPHAIPLDDKGKTSISWGRRYSGLFYVNYNAECWAQGTGASVQISIMVDGAQTKPGGNTILCSETPNSGASPVTGTRMSTVEISLTGQPHTIQIIGTGVNTASWQTAHTYLVIDHY